LQGSQGSAGINGEIRFVVPVDGNVDEVVPGIEHVVGAQVTGCYLSKLESDGTVELRMMIRGKLEPEKRKKG
jgi:hypothetical protein